MTDQRPKIVFKLSRFERTLNAVAVALILASIGLVVGFWNHIPDVIPLHLNFSGHIDRYGSKYYLFILIGVAVLIFTLLSILTRFPQYFNYPVVITKSNALEKYKIARTLVHLINSMTILIISVFILALVTESHSIIYPSAVIYAVLSILISLTYITKLYKNH